VAAIDFTGSPSGVTDIDGHGSNVSSIIASSNATYPGVAPGADIIHLKVLGDDGSGSFRTIEQALQWVVANADTYNIASVNLSLGDGRNHGNTVAYYGLTDEFAAIASQDIIVAASAGNSFFGYDSVQGVGYPAADPYTIAVGAVFSGGSAGGSSCVKP
ncbi:MAG: S8 family serine peptidase, partial [Acidobacteriota bacterium]